MAADSKLPPLTRALQKFLAGMQLPPSPNRGPNPNKDYALLLNALAWHARNVTERAASIVSSPSLKQLSDVMFCSTRTVSTIIDKLFSLGFILPKRRGDGLSSEFTIFQKPQRDVIHQWKNRHPEKKTDQKTVFESEINSRPENSDFSQENLSIQSGKLCVQTRKQFSTSGLDFQGRSPSGEVLQGDGVELKSKATARLFKSEDQIQSQNHEKAKDIFALPECEALGASLGESLGMLPKDIWAVKKAIARIAVLDSIPLPEAAALVKEQGEFEKAKNGAINTMYFDGWVTQIEDERRWGLKRAIKRAAKAGEESEVPVF